MSSNTSKVSNFPNEKTNVYDSICIPANIKLNTYSILYVVLVTVAFSKKTCLVGLSDESLE